MLSQVGLNFLNDSIESLHISMSLATNNMDIFLISLYT